MNATATQKIKLGTFAVIAAAVFMAAIFIIGNKRNMFANTYTIYGSFRNIGGLQIGNNVRFSGINIGTVESINIVNDSTVKVTMQLKEKVRRFIKSDATATIGSDGLMGDKLVNISPGDGNGAPIADNGQVNTLTPTDFDKIILRVSHVVDNAEVITSSLADMANHISSRKGSIGRLIYSDSLAVGLESTLASTKKTVMSAQKGAEGFKENMDAMKHNFLLKGYYKRKAKKERKEELKKEQEQSTPESK